MPRNGIDWFIATVTVGSAALLVIRHHAQPLQAAAIAIVVAVAGWLAVIDIAEHRLPNRIVGPLAAFVLVAVVLFGLEADALGQSLRAVLVGGSIFAVLFVAALGGVIGMGDAKLSLPYATLLAWFTGPTLQLAGLVTVFAAGIFTVGLLAARRGAKAMIAFGPFMALGFVAGLWVGAA